MKVIKHFRGSAFLYRPERAKAVTAFFVVCAVYRDVHASPFRGDRLIIYLPLIYIMIQYFAASVK